MNRENTKCFKCDKFSHWAKECEKSKNMNTENEYESQFEDFEIEEKNKNSSYYQWRS
jgi:hypothetical protein